MDYVNGQPVARRQVRGEETLVGTHQGGVDVLPGARLHLSGQQQGSLYVEEEAVVDISGSHQGSLHVASGAVVSVKGSQQGSVHVERGGRVVVGPQGQLAGSLHVDGVVDNAGIRGGSISGHGVINDLVGARVKSPVLRSGMSVYEW